MDNNKPNVVIIYADDLGFGDLGCYGACDIPTPNVDKLAENGLRFVNGYSTSSVCTPARYSLLTGEYSFRNPNAYILSGDAQCIIDQNIRTMPKIFQEAGYKTGVVGKWHLGLGDGKIDWNKEIPHGPLDVGFDYSFIFPATNDRVPCVYINGRKVEGLDPNDPIEVCYNKECPFDDIPTYEKNPEILRLTSSHGHNQSIINGVGRIGYMRGGKSAIWKDEDLAETFLQKAKDFVAENKDRPFFLYYALHQPHVPRLPSKRFKGVTKLGPRGDVIAEMDWCVGEFMNTLKELDLLDNTIVIFSSDNGPVLDDGYDDKAVNLNGAHQPAGPLRGGKYSKFEGGTRVPFIVSWNSVIKPGVSHALISQVDLLASFAHMLNISLDEEDAPDSFNMLPAILGQDPIGRKELLFEGGSKGKGFVLRRSKWAYILPSNGPAINKRTNIELGNSKDAQLYNLSYDINQQKNVAPYYPDIVESMDSRIKEILKSKRTR